MKRLIFTILLLSILTNSHATYFNSPVTLRLQDEDASFFDNATISEIFKDRRGFMWFASDRGILCYGGVTSREFRYINGRHSIYQMAETFEEIFFLFSEQNNIGCFDRRAEKFIPVKFDNDLLANQSNHFHYNPKTGLYAANASGLYAIDYRIENRGNDARVVLIPRKINQVKQSLQLASSDTSGNIYAVERESLDIIRYSPQTGTVKTFTINLPTDPIARKAYHFVVLGDVMWMTYSWNRMLCYDIKNESQLDINVYDAENQLNIDFGEIRKIIKLDPETYCFATGNGVVSVHFKGRPSDQYKVIFSPFINDGNGNFIEPRTTALYGDTENRLLWTGTYGGGVVRYGDALDTHISIPDVQIYSVTEDKRGYIWLTTAREGIMRSDSPTLDAKTTFSLWTSLGLNRQRFQMYNDGERYLWFGNNIGNIIRVDQYTEEIAKFQVTLDGHTPLPTRINSMCADSRGNLWIASDNRLLRWDQRSTMFDNIKVIGLPNGSITRVIEDRQGILWLGTANGLFMVEHAPDDTYKATGGYEITGGAKPSEVYGLEINGKGDVIATYSDKLLRIGAQAKHKVELFLSIDNKTLPCGHILKILDDKYGNTWFGANTRIMTIRSGGSNMFTYSMSSNNRDGCRLRDGRLVWTASEGLTYFSPEQAQWQSMSANFVLSRIKIHGRDVYAGEKVGGVETFSKSINDVDRLVFSQDQTDFQIFVSDLSYTPFQKQLLYRLDPIMTEWRAHSAEQGITFPGLQHGEYKLRIRPLYLDESQGEEKVITIIIELEWYNSVFAKIIFLLIFGSGVWGILLYARNRWQEVKRRQVHRVFEAINSNTDQDVVDSAVAGDEQQAVKMLIIGNDREMAGKLTELFADEFDVVQSSNSADGIIDALFHLPRVVLCLYSMPGALECCLKMKNNDRTAPIPFILIDSIDDPSNRSAAVEARADDYIFFDEAESSMVRQVVDNRVAGQEAIHQIYSRILIDRNQTQAGTELPGNGGDDSFTRSVVEVIEANLRDSEFSVKRLAELMGMSQSTLYRKLLASSGRTVIEAVRDARLRKAAELLYEGRLTIQAIAEEVGYADVATFRKHFVDLYGVNPSRFGKN